MKRAHLCAVAMGRRLFRGQLQKEPGRDETYEGVAQMTPARFDILYFIYRATSGGHCSALGMGLRDLRRMLGLHKTTISKAIKRLIELELVEADTTSADRRSKLVRLTETGRARIRQALHLLFTERPIARHMRRFARQYVNRSPRSGLKHRIDEHLEAIWDRIYDLARHFDDRSEGHDLLFIPFPGWDGPSKPGTKKTRPPKALYGFARGPTDGGGSSSAISAS